MYVFGTGPYRRKGILDTQRAKFFLPATRSPTSDIEDVPCRRPASSMHPCELENSILASLVKRLVREKRILVGKAGAHLANDREKDEKAERKRLK